MNRANTSMLTGSISGSLLAFAVPLLLGSLFQQLYNAVDSLVVGNFLGELALAAVSSASAPINMMVDIFTGLFAGAGILTATAFGSDDSGKVLKAVHTTLAFSVAVGLVMTFGATLLAPALLSWMDTPETVMGESLAYFRVYFSGSLAFILYNSCTGILRSVGDSVHPLIYLIAASVITWFWIFFLWGCSGGEYPR